MSDDTVPIDVEIDGTSHTLKFRPLAQIPAGVLRKARKNPEEQLWGPFEWGLSDDDLAVLDRMPMGELPNVMSAWEKASETSVGESPAS
jgi:hypothetical protein